MMRCLLRFLAFAALLTGLGPAIAQDGAIDAPAPAPAPTIATPVETVPADTGSAEAGRLDARPALWVVRDADTTIYLFGTIHILRPEIVWFEGPIRAAFDASQQVVVEVVPRPGDEGLMARRGIRTEGAPLSALLPAPHWQRYVQALEAAGLGAAQADQVKPWFAALMLSVAPLDNLGYTPEYGADAVIQAAATEAGKTLTGLETTEEQVGFFDTLPADDQLALLKQTLDEIPSLHVTLEKMIGAWARGDPERLGPLLNETMKGSTLLEKRLLAERNARWADWIKARLDQPGTVFIAVGAGHLAGSASVQHMLRQRGLQAELVRGAQPE